MRINFTVHLSHRQYVAEKCKLAFRHFEVEAFNNIILHRTGQPVQEFFAVDRDVTDARYSFPVETLQNNKSDRVPPSILRLVLFNFL
jgi:hypothetical protein